MNQAKEFFTMFREVSRLYDSFVSPVKEARGLTRCELDILAFLRNNPGNDTARDIIEKRCLPKANASVAVDSLVRKGLLSRAPDPADRRLTRLVLTEAADDVLPDILKAQAAFQEAFFAGLSEEEVRQYHRLNEKLFDGIQKAATGRNSDAGE